MIPHATKSGKRHRKFFLLDYRGTGQPTPRLSSASIAKSSKGPCVSRLKHLYRKSRRDSPAAMPPPSSEADMWVGADYKIQ